MFTELIVALSSVIDPYPLPSAFVTFQTSPLSSGISIVAGAENTVDGEMPCSSAATSAKGLNADPDCRPVPPSPVARG